MVFSHNCVVGEFEIQHGHQSQECDLNTVVFPLSYLIIGFSTVVALLEQELLIQSF